MSSFIFIYSFFALKVLFFFLVMCTVSVFCCRKYLGNLNSYQECESWIRIINHIHASFESVSQIRCCGSESWVRVLRVMNQSCKSEFWIRILNRSKDSRESVFPIQSHGSESWIRAMRDTNRSLVRVMDRSHESGSQIRVVHQNHKPGSLESWISVSV